MQTKNLDTKAGGQNTQVIELDGWEIEAAIKGDLTFGQTREVLAAVAAERSLMLEALREIASGCHWKGKSESIAAAAIASTEGRKS